MLDVAGLHVAYGRSPALVDVDLHVPDGGVTVLMGRNGVGKTTLLNTIMGVLRPTAGTIRFEGRDLAGTTPYQRARLGIGYVPQGQVAFPQLSVRENLAVVLEASGADDRTPVDEALDRFPALVGLLGRPAGLLSGGQRQQLAMARALVTRPRLLILDEPTEGIQPSIVAEIETSILDLHAATGVAILLVEQYLDFAMRVSDTYAVLEAGEVVAAGATADLDPASLHGTLAV